MKQIVSIIIPNYNHKPYLQQRLDSVFNQTYQKVEVILLDDASTDGSADLLNSYKNHPNVTHVVLNTVNSGSPFKQWQKGFALAKGEYIWIAESDDYCDFDFLETCLKRLNNDVGIVYVQSVDVDSNGKQLSPRINYTASFKPNIWKDNFTMKGTDFIENYLLVKNVIPNASAVVFKRELVNSKYFNDNLLKMKMCGDWFFWLQLVNKTNIVFINKSLNYFRNHKLITRNHYSIEKKKARLLEEKTIRNYFFKEKGLSNKIAEKQMIMKWFELHTVIEIFRRYFLEIKLAHTTTFIFFKEYINYKLKNYK